MNTTALSEEILKEYQRLITAVNSVPKDFRNEKILNGTGGKVSVIDIISYQIGWGKCLIRWYEAGIKDKIPQMPGDGFTSWNYVAIAQHFYQKYPSNQEDIFAEVIIQITGFVEKENQTGNLNKLGMWPWCTLRSGKQWPLSKWVKVNTVSPYKRATRLIESKLFLLQH